MLEKGMDEKLLRYMYEQHILKHGHNSSNLENSKLSIAAGHGLAEVIPGIYPKADGMYKSQVRAAAGALQQKGHVEIDWNDGEFWLTPEEYTWASRGNFRRALEFLNENPGLSIPLSLLALLVAGAALLLDAF